MIAAVAVEQTELRAGDGDQQQQQAQQLQQKAPRLLDSAAMAQFGANVSVRPESQRGDAQFLFGPVQQIERHYGGGDHPGNRQQLAQAEVDERHLLQSSAVQE